MPKIDYKTRDLILKNFGESALADFEKLSYADRYLYKQYIFKECISPKQWIDLRLNKKKTRGKYRKLFDKESSDFSADELAKELGIDKKEVWNIYNSALKKIRKILSENPQKYELLREYLRYCG